MANEKPAKEPAEKPAENLTEEFAESAKKPSSESDRTIMLAGEIDDDMATKVVGILLDLEEQDPEAPIHMFINSPGGDVAAGLMIYDAMMIIKPPVHTTGIGTCASMASFLLSAGNPGNRSMWPNTQDMAHQPSGGRRGKESDIHINAERVKHIRNRMERLYAHFIDVPYNDTFKELIHDVMENDSYFNATMALKLGLIDKVQTPRDARTRESDFKIVMEINQMEYDKIGKDSPKNMQAAKRLIEARDTYMTSQQAKPAAPVPPPAPRLAANQP